jgi:hypothetical protein
VQIKGTAHPMYDLMGKEASFFRYATRDGSPVSAQYSPRPVSGSPPVGDDQPGVHRMIRPGRCHERQPVPAVRFDGPICGIFAGLPAHGIA